MSSITDKFRDLGVDHAPGQETRCGSRFTSSMAIGEALQGEPIDFSHGDVNADAFEPTPGAFDVFAAGFSLGGGQAYTEYRGEATIRQYTAEKLCEFTKSTVPAETLIVTPGTQAALFLAIMSTVNATDKVAIVQPDYFANRKIVKFAGGEPLPVKIAYLKAEEGAGLDLSALEAAFLAGAKTFIFSNPNNPVGVVYSPSEVASIARLANTYGVTVIVDQLYSRLLYPGAPYTHLCSTEIDPRLLVTIMGPSKTESLSGFRLGVAFGAPEVVSRMEKLQAIVSLRAPGYCQAVLRTWFSEPAGWLSDRIVQHRAIRDALIAVFGRLEDCEVRAPDAGSYLFPRLPALTVLSLEFVQLLRAQAGVTVTPGTEFSPDASDSIRLNFSQNRARAVHGAQRIVAITQRYLAGS